MRRNDQIRGAITPGTMEEKTDSDGSICSIPVIGHTSGTCGRNDGPLDKRRDHQIFHYELFDNNAAGKQSSSDRMVVRIIHPPLACRSRRMSDPDYAAETALWAATAGWFL